MKKFLIILVLIVLSTFVFGICVETDSEVISSIGKYDDCDKYSEGVFQDFTYYNKYYFSSANLENNKFFSKVTEDDIAVFNEHLDDFESWIDTYRDGDDKREIVVNYDFDRSCIDTDDYIYIITSAKDPYDDVQIFANYDIYFYDTESNVLYYFHNNI